MKDRRSSLVFFGLGALILGVVSETVYAFETQCLTSKDILEKQYLQSAELPSCKDQDREPRVIDATMPVRGVFLACRTDIVTTCRSLAEGLIDHHGGATVNIIVQQEELKHEEMDRTIKGLRERARLKGAALNVLSTVLRPHVFMRDPGIFLSRGYEEVVFRGVPLRSYQPFPPSWEVSRSGGYAVAGDWTVAEAVFQCGVPSHLNISSAELATVIRQYQETKDLQTVSDFDLNWTGEKTKSVEALLQTTFAKLYKKWSAFSNAEMGGNYLGLPGETDLGPLVGKTPRLSPIAMALGSKRWSGLEIPELKVGHIDEVFQLVPGKNSAKCPFTLLRASPLLAREVLLKIPAQTVVGYRWEFQADYKSPDFSELIKDAEASQFAKTIKDFFSNRLEVASLTHESRQAILDFTEVYAKAKRVTDARVQDVIASQEMVAKWGVQQEIIEQSSKTLVQHIQEQTGHCTEVVDLPVLWNNEGKPAMANPINGLVLNGVYLVSQQNTKGIMLHRMKNPDGVEYYIDVPKWTRHEVLEKFIAGLIVNHTSLRPVFLDTRDLDDGGGNIHCATSEVRVDCR